LQPYGDTGAAYFPGLRQEIGGGGSFNSSWGQALPRATRNGQPGK
jgi:hypothetical protein